VPAFRSTLRNDLIYPRLRKMRCRGPVGTTARRLLAPQLLANFSGMLRLRQIILDLAVPPHHCSVELRNSGPCYSRPIGEQTWETPRDWQCHQKAISHSELFSPQTFRHPPGTIFKTFASSLSPFCKVQPPDRREPSSWCSPTRSNQICARWFMSRTCTISEYLVICGPYAMKTKGSPIKSRGTSDSLILPKLSVK
jgi:hypothetical protein